MIQPGQAQVNFEIPANIQQEAGTYNLGVPIAVYKPLFSNIFAIIGMVVGAIIADIVLLYILVALTGYLFYILIILPIVAFIYGIVALVNYNLRIYQFSNGLIHAPGHLANPIRWDQIASVKQQAPRNRYYAAGAIGALIGSLMSSRSSHSFTVLRNDGATFKFTSVLRNVTQLGQSIQQAVTQLQMPQAMAAFNSGASVPFGPLAISRQGLSNGRETLPWNEVQSVTISQGQFIVKKVNKTFKWANVNISQIPNLQLFMGLVNYGRTGNVS